MVNHGVNVCTEPVRVDGGRVGEGGPDHLCGDELSASKWDELSQWDAIARDDERLASIEASHDLAAVISQLPLRDFFSHA